MRELTFAEALGEAILEEMSKDPTIFTYGEDIAKQGGIFGAYKSLLGKFPDRVIDTPISEEVLLGSALGAALAGMRPIAEFHFADFLFTGMTAVTNQIMKFRYMTGGQAKIHLVLRGPDGITRSGAAQHSESIETLFMHIPGIKIIVPATPYDMKGLFKTALKSDDPVICFEHKRLYETKGFIPDEEYYIPFGVADVKRQGTNVTIVSTSRMLLESLKAAEDLQKEGINSEVIDLRTLIPWDKQTVLNSVKKTHHLIVAHETWRRAGWGAEIAATVQEEAFSYLEAPILRVGAKNVHIPFSPDLQDFVVPNHKNVVNAVRKVLRS